jgi:hypothetical protein
MLLAPLKESRGWVSWGTAKLPKVLAFNVHMKRQKVHWPGLEERAP